MRMFLLLLIFTGILGFVPSHRVHAQEQWLYIASPDKPAAIYTCSLNLKTGEMGELKIAADEVFTGFLAFHPTLPILYAATSETVGPEEMNGYVRAYQINPETKKLTLLNQASTADNGTTHIQVAPNGKYVAVCHYSGLGTSVIGLNPDGTLQQKCSQIKHVGSSVHQRQKSPHPHGVAISADSKYVCVADLGNDHVEVFFVTPDSKLKPGSFWRAKPGAGPRHVTFHPERNWLYCINELDSTISVLDFNPVSGQLVEIETVNTLPADFNMSNTTAELAIHPEGQWLYGSNRGHNSSAAYRINQQTGRLSLIEHEPTLGDHPRFIGLDPTGQILIAANTFANTLVSFHVDQETGALTPTEHQRKVAKPMCVLFCR